MNRLLLIALLIAAACPRSSPVAPSAPPELGPVRGTDGSIYAVVFLRSSMEEASNLGGEHDVFEIDGPVCGDVRLAHGGGHGLWYGFDIPEARTGASDVFVAELQMHPRRAYTYDHADGGWGTTRLPPFDAEVVRLMPMRDLETARAALPRLASHQQPFQALAQHDRITDALPQ